MKKVKSILVLAALAVSFIACDDDDTPKNTPKDPDTAPAASIDRFSEDAGTLMVRSAGNSLPAANVAINFDSGEPFITQGLGPDGEIVQYYNFDVQPVEPAPIYAFFHANGSAVDGQLNVINVIPGDDDYNDFWRIHKVTVPNDYVANTVASFTDIQSAGYSIEETTMLVNCPVVPKGSTATKRLDSESADLHRGWYKDQVVYYFTFSEKSDGLSTSAGEVPVSPIYVSFNINPDPMNANSGPASGFKTEEDDMDQTHNVVATLPADNDYSPLWWVNIYNNDDFDGVDDLTSAAGAEILVNGAAEVNCPIVSIEE